MASNRKTEPGAGASAAQYVTQFMGGGDRMDLPAGKLPDSPSPAARAQERLRAEGSIQGSLEEHLFADTPPPTSGGSGNSGNSEKWRTWPHQPRRSAGPKAPPGPKVQPTTWTKAGGWNHGANPHLMPKFAFHATGMDRILAGRNPIDANHVMDLCGQGITHILDLREEGEWTAPRLGQAALAMIAQKGIQRLNLPIRDTFPPTAQQLDEAMAFIDAALTDPSAKVYVHCRAGRGRTGAILLAYGASRPYGTIGRAMEAIGRKYPPFSPTLAQERMVRRWHQPLLKVADPGALAPIPAGSKLLACDGCDRVFDVAGAVVSFTCLECALDIFPPPPPRLVVPVGGMPTVGGTAGGAVSGFDPDDEDPYPDYVEDPTMLAPEDCDVFPREDGEQAG